MGEGERRVVCVVVLVCENCVKVAGSEGHVAACDRF